MENGLKCDICLDFFDAGAKKPRLLLNCGHTLCEACLKNLLSFSSSKSCPQCRKPDALSSSLDRMPINYNLLRIIENYKKQPVSDDKKSQGATTNQEQTKNSETLRTSAGVESKTSHLRASTDSSSEPYSLIQNISRLFFRNPSSVASSVTSRNPTVVTNSVTSRNPTVVTSSVTFRNPTVVTSSVTFRNPSVVTSSVTSRNPTVVTSSVTSSQNGQTRRNGSSDSFLNNISRQSLSNASVPSYRQHLVSSNSALSTNQIGHNIVSNSSNASLQNTPLPRSQSFSLLNSFARRTSSPSVRYSQSYYNDELDAKMLQEELDCQMAIHLTFCKDPNHKHDDPIHRPSPWQYPEDDDLNLALRLSLKD